MIQELSKYRDFENAGAQLLPRGISQTMEINQCSPHLPKSSFPKKQPVLTPFSVVHVMSFRHLKTQLNFSRTKHHLCLHEWHSSWFHLRIHTLSFHFTHTTTAAHKSGQSNHARKQHRHSIAGVFPIQRTQSDNLPPPANGNQDQSQLALRKVMSDGPVKPEGGEQKGAIQSTQQEHPPNLRPSSFNF